MHSIQNFHRLYSLILWKTRFLPWRFDVFGPSPLSFKKKCCWSGQIGMAGSLAALWYWKRKSDGTLDAFHLTRNYTRMVSDRCGFEDLFVVEFAWPKLRMSWHVDPFFVWRIDHSNRDQRNVSGTKEVSLRRLCESRTTILPPFRCEVCRKWR